jgi:hypothetical protein
VIFPRIEIVSQLIALRRFAPYQTYRIASRHVLTALGSTFLVECVGGPFSLMRACACACRLRQTGGQSWIGRALQGLVATKVWLGRLTRRAYSTPCIRHRRLQRTHSRVRRSRRPFREYMPPPSLRVETPVTCHNRDKYCSTRLAN